jgi:regulator of sigma E protease
MNYFVAIITAIVMIGALISLHEAGHLAAAKIFNVCCLDYSIGFGPAIFHRKRKRGETYFSIRAIPLGGFVLLYDGTEPVKDDSGNEIPLSRSMKGTKRWKKAIIMSAGVAVNFLLGFLLIFVSYSCFEQSYARILIANDVSCTPMSVREEGSAYAAGLRDGDALLETYFEEDGNSALVLAGKADIGSDSYCVAYYPQSLKSPSVLSSSVRFFVPSSDRPSSVLTDDGFVYLPDFSKAAFVPSDGQTVRLTFEAISSDRSSDWSSGLTDGRKTVSADWAYGTDGLGTDVQVVKRRLAFGRALSLSGESFSEGCVSVFKAIGGMFKGDFSTVGGPVAMTKQVVTLQSDYTPSYVFLYAGLISVNLAIFNLLPIPALDGGQLLLLAVEAVRKKDVSTKTKTIMSLVGIGIMTALSVAVLIKDLTAL